MEIRTTAYIRYLITIIIVPLCLCTPLLSRADDIPHPFTAQYSLEKFGTTLARATYSLGHTKDGLYMTQSTRPAGLLALFLDDELDVRSDMTIVDGKVLLTRYDYKHTGDDKDRNVWFDINWKRDSALNGKAKGINKGEKVDIEIHTPVWDPLSIQIPLMMDASKNLKPHQHSLFLKGEFKNYLFENHGKKTIAFNDKEYTAIKIVGRETERDRAMHTWLVPDLHYLPVKIEQWKNGKLNSTVIIESVIFNGEEIILFNNNNDEFDD